MKLRSLRIDQLHTANRIELQEFGPCVNVVLGANGSGKSTSVLAIQGLLWPEVLARISYPQLQSTWELDNSTLRIERKGKETLWFLDSNKVEAPLVPPPHLAACYTLTLDDIFDGEDKELAEEVERDFAGGYDFKALKESCFHSHSRTQVTRAQVTRARNDLVASEKTLREKRSVQEALFQQERLLEKHYTTLKEIESAEKRERLLEKLLSRTQKLAEHLRLQHEIDSYPEAHSSYRGFEHKRALELLSRSEKLQKERKEIFSRKHAAEETIGLSRIGSDTLEAFNEELCLKLLESLRSEEHELDSMRGKALEEKVRLEDLSSKVPGISKIAQATQIGGKEVDEMLQAYRSFDTARLRYEAKQEELAMLQTELPASVIEQHLANVREKKQLLTNLVASDASLSRNRLPLAAFSVLSLCLAGISTHSLDSSLPRDLHSLTVGALIGVSVLSAIALLISRIKAARELKRLSTTILEDTLEAPTLQELNKQLDSEIATHSLELERIARTRGVSQSIQLAEEELKNAENNMSQLGLRLGAAPSFSRGGLPYFIESIVEFQKAARSFAASKTRGEFLVGKHAETLLKLNAALSPLSAPKLSSFVEASASFSRAQTTISQHRNAVSEAKLLGEQEQTLTQAIGEVDSETQGIFTSLGLSDNSADTLEVIDAKHEEFQTLTKRASILAHEFETIEKEVGDSESLLLEEEAIHSLLASSREQLSQKNDLVREIDRVETAIARTKRERVLEKALHQASRAEEKLLELFEKDRSDALASVLVGSVETEYRSRSLPLVLKEAQKLFALFTQGKYTFLPSDPSASDSSGFRAEDTSTGEILPLEHLSRGTRTQLLLAARLAFAKRHELKHPLPFVMDEVLSTSDPQRFAAIAESMLRLAIEENRQILYFSSQPEDLARWLEVSKRLNLGEVHSQELSPNFTPFAPTNKTAFPEHKVPKPSNGEDYRSYLQRLAIEELKASTTTDGIHLGYLLDSCDLLYSLLVIGIERYAQFRLLQAGPEALVSELEFSQAAARAEVLTAIAKAARHGRGKRLTPEVIVEQKVSDKLKEPMIDLLEKVDRNASEYLDALKRKEIPGFRQTAISRLEGHFLQEGFVSLDSPLDENEARARVVAEIAPHLQSQILTSESFNSMFSELWPRLAKS